MKKVLPMAREARLFGFDRIPQARLGASASAGVFSQNGHRGSHKKRRIWAERCHAAGGDAALSSVDSPLRYRRIPVWAGWDREVGGSNPLAPIVIPIT